MRLIGDCVAQRAKKLEIAETEAASTTGTLDQNAMLEQIEQGIANKYGASLTFPATSGFAPFLRQARKHGILVGTFWGSAGTQSGANVSVGANFSQVGEIFAAAMAARPGEQHVGLLVSGPTGAGKAFVDGFRAPTAKKKNVTVEAVVFDNDDASKALDLTNAMLAAHPDINVIASHTGTATQGATAAIKARGLVGKVVFVANGTAGGGLHGFDNGGADNSMVDAIAKIAEGEQVPARIDVGIQMLGKKPGGSVSGEGMAMFAVESSNMGAVSTEINALVLRGIAKSFGQLRALTKVDFAAHAGEIHAVAGDNGAGKSTTLKIMCGIHRNDAGSLVINGGSVAKCVFRPILQQIPLVKSTTSRSDTGQYSSFATEPYWLSKNEHRRSTVQRNWGICTCKSPRGRASAFAHKSSRGRHSNWTG
jgi:ABC-type sugar transport system substrate-binding protein